jgi:hypothetical protein
MDSKGRKREVLFKIKGTDPYPVSGLKYRLTEVDICKDFRIEIPAIYCSNMQFISKNWDG